MESSVQIALSPEVYLLEIQRLQQQLREKDKYAKQLTEEIEQSRNIAKEITTKATKKTTKVREVTLDTNEYSDFKSDGKRKAHAAESIRSYDDFKAIQDYYLNKGRIRDWTLWTFGVSSGLRISDLLALRFRDVVAEDRHTFHERIKIYEKKTGKMNNILITPSMIYALNEYFSSIKWEFDLDNFLFYSHKTKGKMYEECGWRILSSAGKALNLPFHMGSHTMRKSFANIAACVDTSVVDMNAITKIQGLLNHSDQRVTMGYLGSYQDMYDKARMAVSDFCLGKTDINELFIGNRFTTDDLMERLQNIEDILSEKNNE